MAALVAQNSDDLDQLVAQLSGHDQRLALAKLAFEMACSSQDPGDTSPINNAERGAYRRLLEALDLPEAEVNEAEWAARQAMQEAPALLDRFNRICLAGGPGLRWTPWSSRAPTGSDGLVSGSHPTAALPAPGLADGKAPGCGDLSAAALQGCQGRAHWIAKA